MNQEGAFGCKNVAGNKVIRRRGIERSGFNLGERATEDFGQDGFLSVHSRIVRGIGQAAQVQKEARDQFRFI